MSDMTVTELQPLVTRRGNPATACKVCQRPISNAYMSGHMRKVHGVFGGRTGKRRKQTAKAQRQQAMTPVHMPPPVQNNNNVRAQKPVFKVAPFVVLEDNQGGIWIAEKLR